jgi:hypothetical protein
MQNKFFLLFFGVLLLSFTSSMYAGETNVYPNEFGSDNLLYTIIDNTSYIIYPIVNINLTNISITIPDNSNPNSYKIVFIENNTQTIVQTIQVQSSSSGGGHTRIITKETVKEVPNYVTEYLDNETIKLVNNETIKEVPLENKGYYIWIGLVFGICFSFILIFIAIKIFINHIRKEKRK